jgi:hypothetical protein
MKRVSKGRVSLPTTFTAVIAIAITFTFNGCSSDDDGGGGGVVACKSNQVFYEPINGKTSGEVCGELSEEQFKNMSDEENLSASELKKEIKRRCESEFDEDGEKQNKGKFYDTCPEGYVLKCAVLEETIYLYGDEFKGVNCREFHNNL